MSPDAKQGVTFGGSPETQGGATFFISHLQDQMPHSHWNDVFSLLGWGVGLMCLYIIQTDNKYGSTV